MLLKWIKRTYSHKARKGLHEEEHCSSAPSAQRAEGIVARKDLCKTYYSFLSYSTRDDEVKIIKPFVDDYVNQLRRHGIHYIPIYYDGFYIEKRHYLDDELWQSLCGGLMSSDFTTAFVSPGYLSSEWCEKEWHETERLEKCSDVSKNSKPRILPICWKRFDLHYNAQSYISELENSVSRRNLLDVSNELTGPHPNYEKAIFKAVEGTIDFLKRFYELI